MKYVHGLSNDEIAETLQITKKNVQARIFRGNAKLKAQLMEEGVQDGTEKD